MCEKKDQEQVYGSYTGHTPKVGDILILPERVYNRWVVSQVFNQAFNQHLKDYTQGDIVFVIRPIAIDEIQLSPSEANMRTQVISLLELSSEFHSWEGSKDEDSQYN